MKPAPARFGWAALGVAWAVDWLFWQKAPGISLPLWVAIALVAGILLARSLKVRPSPLSLVLMALALIFAGVTFIRREAFTLVISVLLCFLAMSLLAATFQTGNWAYYKISDFIKAAGKLLLAWLVRPIGLFTPEATDPSPASPETVPDPLTPPASPSAGAVLLSNAAALTPRPATARGSAAAQSLPVIRGLFLALPVVLVLGSLLAAADPVFSHWAGELFKNINLDRLPEYLFRLIYIGMIAYGLAGTYLHAIRPAGLEARPCADGRWFAPFLGWIESGIVLGAVNLLFMVFVAIQFWYLFGGQANISTTGFTYSEYARRGFNELVVVALLSLGLYLGLAAVARQDTPRQRAILLVLNVLLIAQVLIILGSSYNRLALYEDAYGFTQLRTYTHILIVWLGLLLAATIAFEIMRRRDRFALAALLAVFGFGLTFGILNVDGFIARQNIQRAGVNGKLDGQYLATLSEDAVPVLVEALQRADQPAALREIIAVELSCRENAGQGGNSAPSWLSYNLSQATALSLLQANHALWQAYPVQSGTEGDFVALPRGKHLCQANRSTD